MHTTTRGNGHNGRYTHSTRERERERTELKGVRGAQNRASASARNYRTITLSN